MTKNNISQDSSKTNFTSDLLAWYNQNARKLPWREKGKMNMSGKRNPNYHAQSNTITPVTRWKGSALGWYENWGKIGFWDESFIRMLAMDGFRLVAGPLMERTFNTKVKIYSVVNSNIVVRNEMPIAQEKDAAAMEKAVQEAKEASEAAVQAAETAVQSANNQTGEESEKDKQAIGKIVNGGGPQPSSIPNSNLNLGQHCD